MGGVESGFELSGIESWKVTKCIGLQAGRSGLSLSGPTTDENVRPNLLKMPQSAQLGSHFNGCMPSDTNGDFSSKRS